MQSAVVSLAVLAVYCFVGAMHGVLFDGNELLFYGARFGLLVAFAVVSIRGLRNVEIPTAIGDRARQANPDPLLTFRTLACFVVLVGHATTSIYNPVTLPGVSSRSHWFWLFMPMPWSGVWLFFVLSGYLMGKGFFTGRRLYSGAGVAAFYQSRLRRIAPLYWFAVLAYALLVHPEIFWPQWWLQLAALLAFDFDSSLATPTIGLLWSVATEMQFYLLVPFLAVIMVRAFRGSVGRALLFVGLAIAAGLAWRLGWWFWDGDLAHWGSAVYTPTFGNLDLFAIGMAAAWLVQAYPMRWPQWWHGVALMAVIWIAGCWLWTAFIVDAETWSTFSRYVAPSFFGVAAALTIVVLEQAPRAAGVTGAIVRATQWTGILTYAIYVWHVPIMQAHRRLIERPATHLDTVFALLTVVPLIAAAAIGSYVLVEQRFRSSPGKVNTGR